MADPKAHRLTRKIVIAMLAGMVLGIALNLVGAIPWLQLFVVDGLLQVIGSIFVAALKMMVVPLVFVSLVVGVTALSDCAVNASLTTAIPWGRGSGWGTALRARSARTGASVRAQTQAGRGPCRR